MQASSFEFVALHDVLATEEYKVHIEQFRRGQDDFLLLHWRYFKWTPSVFKRSIAHWHALRRCVTAPLFALGEVDADKWQRFVTRFGFTYLQDVICENGESRRLFIHRLSEAPTPNVRIRLQKFHVPDGDDQLDG